MAGKVKNYCPNCSQPYGLSNISPTLKGRIPLLLPCGHSACEGCIRNIVNFSEPLICKICESDEDYLSENAKALDKKSDLYSVFPVNMYLLGELTLQLSQHHILHSHAAENKGKGANANYIDLQAIINSADSSMKNCSECKALTPNMCKQCITILCEPCFNKIHQSFKSLKNHEMITIALDVVLSYCTVHKDKSLDYYCTDCSKPLCMDCMIVGEKSCKTHTVISIQEQNNNMEQDLKDVTEKVDEVYRLLTNTAVSVGNILEVINTDEDVNSEAVVMEMQVKQHFSKLHAIIQIEEEIVLKQLETVKQGDMVSLHSARNMIENNLKMLVTLLGKLRNGIIPANANKVNLSALLEDGKKAVDCAWYLSKQEPSDTAKTLSLSIDPEVFDMLKGHARLEGLQSSGYTLLSTKDIKEGTEIPSAPLKPVLPPTIIKDVREKDKPLAPVPAPASVKDHYITQTPGFRLKSGSVSSINSLGSDTNSCYRLPVISTEAMANLYQSKNSLHNVQTVSPYNASDKPKPLQEGAHELVYVTHINDPSDFYVQRACYQTHVKEMMKQFRNIRSLSQPQVSHVDEGKVFLGFCEFERQWHRCRIINVDRTDLQKPMYHVFYIDFGQTEDLTIEKLRVPPSNRVHTPPPLALHCQLANCMPISGLWTPSDTVLMSQIINNKQAVMYVRRSLGATCFGLALQCDITMCENGESLVHALVFQERAKLENPTLKYLNISGLENRPKLFKSNNMKRGSVEEVLITHIVSPDKFFVRKYHFQQEFEKLQEELDNAYDIRCNVGTVYCPEVGTVCVCNVDKYGEQVDGGGWRRCEVTMLTGRRRLHVLLSDSGHEVVLHSSALRHIQPKFTTLKALAVECHLARICPTNNKWHPGSVRLLEGLATRKLQLHVDEEPSYAHSSTAVTLFNDSDPEERVCINEELVKYKYALPLGFLFEPQSTKQNIQTKAPHMKKKHIVPEVKVKLLSKPSLTRREIKVKDLQAKNKGPLKLEVTILSCQSPSQVYVSLVSQKETLEQLYDNMQKFYNTKKVNRNTDWVEMDKCCAYNPKTKTWSRAVILEAKAETAKVFYTDFAIVDELPYVAIQLLATEFMSVHDGAIKCHLSGISPAVGEEWPAVTRECLQDLIESYQRFFITKNGVIKDKSLPIELWVYHVTPGGALEPNVSEWRRLNDKIIEQGLAIPLPVIGTDTEKNEATEDQASLQNVTGSLSEWLQLETKGTTAHIEEPTENATRTEELYSPASSDCSPSVAPQHVYTDWIPAEPLKELEFLSMPTFVDDEGIIHLHDLRQEDTLDLIRKSLNARFQDSTVKPQDLFWSVGQPCIARFNLDNNYYRGKILEVLDDCKCKVLFVDYGNFEFCPVSHLRKNIVMTQMPIQATRCVMSGISPVVGNWETATLDLVHKLIVEKQCLVKVTGAIVDDLVPIELKVDGIWISDLLADLQYALYTDGRAQIVPCVDLGSIPASNAQKLDQCSSNFDVNDSGPDVIIVDDDMSETSQASFDPRSMENADWSKLMESEETKADKICVNQESAAQCLMYPQIEFPNEDKKSFSCNVSFITGFDSLELLIISEYNKSLALYDKITSEMQQQGSDRPVLNGAFENKACIALFDEDGRWYRAIVLKQDLSRGLIKVKYVDFGNTQIVTLANVRETTKAWCLIPPQALSSKLYGIKLNSGFELGELLEEYENILLNKTLLATIVDKNDDVIFVELRKEENGPLVYQCLLDKGILVLDL